MLLYEECKSCLYNSQIKKVEREQTDAAKLENFRRGVKLLCKSPPADYCAPLLMRDIDALHKSIFGAGIDYSREKSLFNTLLLKTEEELYGRIISSPDPLCNALKHAMTANFIDFARLADLNEGAAEAVIAAASRAAVDGAALASLKDKLSRESRLCFLHDNCGEIVLDKILIRVIKALYPHVTVFSVVRGGAIINDATLADAEEVGLGAYARVFDNGTNIPGTCLKELSAKALSLLDGSGVIISKGLGNLETLYGNGYNVFYAFTCKCAHIAARFGAPLWSSVFTEEE